MPWTKTDIHTPIPKPIAKALKDVDSAVSSITSVLATVSAALNLVKVLAAGYSDLFAALVGALITELETLVNDFFGSGLFMLTITPFNFEQSPEQLAAAVKSYEDDVKAAELQYKRRLAAIDKGQTLDGVPVLGWLQRQNALNGARTEYEANLKNAYKHKSASIGRQYDSVTGWPLLSAAEAIQSAYDSLDDEGDLARPQLSSSAQIAAVGLLVTFPTIQQFLDILDKLDGLLNFPELDFVTRKVKSFADVTDFYFWYKVSGKGTDPLIPHRVGVPIELPDGASSAVVAKATSDIIKATGVFTTTVDQFRVRATCVAKGKVDTDPDAGTSGFNVFISKVGQTGQAQVVELDVTPNFGSIVVPGGGPVLAPSTLQGAYFLLSTHPKTTTSVNPDWRSFRLNSIDHLAALQRLIIKQLETLRGYLVVPDSFIPDLIDIILQKIQVLQELLTAIRQLLNAIFNVSGVYMLQMKTTVGGNEALKRAIRDPFLEDPCNKTSFTVLALFVAGGASGPQALKVVDDLGDLLK